MPTPVRGRGGFTDVRRRWSCDLVVSPSMHKAFALIPQDHKNQSKNTTRLQKVTEAHYEQLCVHKFNNLNEMDRFLKSYRLSKLNKKEIDYLNSPLSISEVEFIVFKVIRRL